MKLEDDHMVAAGNDAVLVGQSPAVATLMPPAATPAVPIATTMGAGGGLFTAAQWVELQRQALIYKHMAASAPIPSYLLFSDINAAAAQAAPSPYYYCYSATPLLLPDYQAQQAARMSVLLQCMQQAVARRRCGRTTARSGDAPGTPSPTRGTASATSTAPAAHATLHLPKSSSSKIMRLLLWWMVVIVVTGTSRPLIPIMVAENRLSLDYDNIADLYCNKQVASMAAPSSSVMDDDASDHGAAATSWVGIGGPLGEVLGLAAQVQWPV
uniref:Uncharacterized protein n=1 Tax=Avena sativa TaxID=4498 RepID=A0ACD5Z7L4_AVESA